MDEAFALRVYKKMDAVDRALLLAIKCKELRILARTMGEQETALLERLLEDLKKNDEKKASLFIGMLLHIP